MLGSFWPAVLGGEQVITRLAEHYGPGFLQIPIQKSGCTLAKLVMKIPVVFDLMARNGDQSPATSAAAYEPDVTLQMKLGQGKRTHRRVE